MGLNYLDVDDAAMLAMQRSKRMLEDWRSRFYQPVNDTRASMLLSAAAQQVSPKLAQRIRQEFGAQTGKKTGKVSYG